MGLLSDSKELREKALSSNLYKPNNIYELSDRRLLESSSSILNVINPSSLVVRNFRDTTPLVEIANNRLLYEFEQRIKSEAIDEVLPPLALDPVGSVSDIIKGSKTFSDTLIKSDDYKISKESSIIGKIGDIIERATGVNFPNNPEKNSYYKLRNQSNWSSSLRIKEETGRVQIRRLIFNTSENFYSRHSTFGSYSDLQGKLEQAIDNYDRKETVTYYLNLGARTIERNQYVNYVKIHDSEEEFYSFEQGLKKYNKPKVSTGINNTINTDTAQEKVIKEGDFGVSSRNSKEITDINGVQTTDETKFINSFNQYGEISYGNTSNLSLTDEVFGFGAKRGLLYYNSKVAQENNIIAKNINQKTVIYQDESGTNISYKVRPCRNFTKVDRDPNNDIDDGKQHYYGKTPKSFIRYYGNGKKGSVLENYVTPKIVPNIPKDSSTDPFSNPQQEALFFSLENLAWTKEDLIDNNIPLAEWGNNFGRYMWFAPYITSYSEKINPSYEQHKFIGRTEPLFTYSNTVRTANLEFFLIIDYPIPADLLDSNDIATFISCDPVNRNSDDFFTPEFTEFEQISKDKKRNSGSGGGGSNGGNDYTLNPEKDTKKEGEKETNKDDDTTSDDNEDVTTSLQVANLDDLNLYFPNDYYNATKTIDSNYEDVEEGSIDTDTEFGNLGTKTYKDVNFKLNDTLNNNFVSDDGINYQELLKNNKYYRFNITGYASKLFLASRPEEYNIYLSARRAFSYAEYILNRLNIDANKYTLADGTLRRKFINEFGNTLQDVINNIDRIKPNIVPGLDITEIFTFINQDGGTFENINIFIKGSSLADSETSSGTDKIINSRETRRTRYASFSVSKNESRIEEENNRLLVERNEQSIPPEIENETNQDDTTGDNLTASTTLNNTVGSTNTNGTTIIDSNINSDKVNLSVGASDDLNYTRFSETHKLQSEGGQDQEHVPRLINYNKKKYYVDLFHSTHPEDYHRRRTFLAQLGYPGNSKTKFGSSNSAFGRMPISILRIGDFIHSKVVIDGIDFSEEELIFDHNYEGMGVQPMITKVSLSFTILGGQSLKSHIDRLQNATSFNHYANSTYYDTGIYKKSSEAEAEQGKINDRRKELIPNINVEPQIDIPIGNSLNQVSSIIDFNSNNDNIA